ncbi:hypothetical protein ACWDG1_09195 [Streptomyces sp. NPDC001177]
MTATGYVSTIGDSRKVSKSGDTMTGDLVLNDSSPDTTNSAASKGYVDTAVATASPWVFDVTASAYGAVGDAQVVTDGAMGSGSAVLTSATANWPTSVVGKAISVKGAGANGVTTLVTTVASRQSATQITLSAANASGGAVSGALVIWGTDDTAAIQAAVDAAEAYLTTHTYAQVYFPPRPYIVAGALSNAKSGNGQITFGVYATTANKRILEFRGESDGAAAVRHWQQTQPQFAGSCLISLGVYSSTSAQITSINAHGNPGVISGPTEGHGYGVNSGGAVFSNVMAVIKDLSILTSHSAYGLTYGAATLWGCANAHIENFGYGTAGVVTGTDYTSPGVFGTGLSVGLLLPAPGNNDHVVARNVSCGGGYTYAMFLTEHAVVDRYMALYCWAGLVAVGTYAGSVGSVHAMHVTSASIEACTHELYIMGAGSQGVGPTIYANISTESSTPNIAGSSAAAMNAALGRIILTGLFTESGVSVSNPTGIELVDGQVPAPIKRKTGAFTASPIDRILICDTTSAGFTGTLPDATYCAAEYVFKNVGANTLTVATTSSQLIYTSSGTGATTVTAPTGQVLRVRALYNGATWGWYALAQNYLQLGGGTVTGDLTVQGYTTLGGGQFNSDFAAFGDMSLIGTGKRYRFRRSGSNLDLEGGGVDLIVSVWSDDVFTATQHSYFRLSSNAQNVQVAGKVEFVDALYGTTKHVLDGAANQIGFYGATPASKPTVTGSRGGNAALASLLSALATLGLITDGSVA